MMLITSPANERLKHARRVRDGREDGLIFIEGERLVEECLQSGLALSACFHSPDSSARTIKILSQIAERGCPLFPTANAVLETVSDTVNTQGIIVLATLPIYTVDQVLSAGKLIVCVDAIQDPGNLGTILRTAEAAGANGILSLKGSVDAYAPKTLRSAMGSAFRLPIATDITPDELLAKSQATGLKVVATMAEGETSYCHFDWQQPSVVVFGNEANGVRPELLQRADQRIRIPLRPPVESLNVAAAAAAILFEAARQRS